MTRGFLVDRCPHCMKSLVQRSVEQNAKLHALLQTIATSKQWPVVSEDGELVMEWLDVEEWKRLLVLAWTRATRGQSRVFRAVDGHGVDVLYRRTSRLSKQEMASLIDWIETWAAEELELGRAA